MSMDRVINHFLSRGLECSVTQILQKKYKVNKKERALRTSCITKTLAFRVRESNILVVTSEDMKVSNGKFSSYFNAKPKELTDSETIMKITGHPIGGLSPLGLKTPLKVYVDISLKRNNYVYLCAGLKNFVVKVTPEELIDLTCGKWIDVSELESHLKLTICN